MKKSNKVSPSASHPGHEAVLGRLGRARGQLDGIERMIRDRRYCVDILVQLRAAVAAIRGVEREVFRRHLEHCVTQAMKARGTAGAAKKIEEVMELLQGGARE